MDKEEENKLGAPHLLHPPSMCSSHVAIDLFHFLDRSPPATGDWVYGTTSSSTGPTKSSAPPAPPPLH